MVVETDGQDCFPQSPCEPSALNHTVCRVQVRKSSPSLHGRFSTWWLRARRALRAPCKRRVCLPLLALRVASFLLGHQHVPWFRASFHRFAAALLSFPLLKFKKGPAAAPKGTSKTASSPGSVRVCWFWGRDPIANAMASQPALVQARSRPEI